VDDPAMTTVPAVTGARTLEHTVTIRAAPGLVFAWLDDPAHTSMHMSRPSMAMLGGALRTEQLSPEATGVGAMYRSSGRAFGIPLDFTTVVTRWRPEREKAWQTIGKPRLIVLRHFEMRFSLDPGEGGTHLTLALEYSLPTHGLGRVLGLALAGPYARWCLRRMLRDAQAALDSGR
jgi:polyketide cyclase/dehydrase/lipid transport protein